MNSRRLLETLAAVVVLAGIGIAVTEDARHRPPPIHVHPATAQRAIAFDTSQALATITDPITDRPASADLSDAGRGVSPPNFEEEEEEAERAAAGIRAAPVIPAAAANVEQRVHGTRAALPLLASFDGLGVGFVGPQSVGGGRGFGNPSDNTLAVGPDHIVQIVNGGMAVFTKKGRLFDTTGKVLYGPMRSNAIFGGFGGPCDNLSSGDAVVRFDQLAQRWLYVLPIFSMDSTRIEQLARVSQVGRAGQPGAAAPRDLVRTPAPPPPPPPPPGQPPQGRGRGGPRPTRVGTYSMCYALSTTTDPLGPYYRYQFVRALFPDYPRPALWPDGYYVPSSTSDNFIQKHACVVERAKMLQGLAATEQCIVIDGVNFLNNADIDGQGVPPDGAPNIVMAAGGTQLHQRFEDDGIYAWHFHVDWDDATKTGLRGPTRIPVAPYHYLCNGQLTRCVPQLGDTNRLDSQGDKLMQRMVYRNVNGHEAIVVQHSVSSARGGGGVRWYEFRLDGKRDPVLFQQGTYAPDSLYRWLGSPAMDRKGNIGIGYSFGGSGEYPGQRFAARLASDPPGTLSFHESVLVAGEAAQPRQLRWEDYTTTAIDPSDDCTFWYVGDYVKKGASTYSSRIGAFRVPGCRDGKVAGSTFFDINHDGLRNGAEPGLPGRNVSYAGGQSGKLATDAAGAFTVTLPADAVYGNTDYTFTAVAPERDGWTATTAAARVATGVSRVGNGLKVQLEDRDFVTGVAFGSVCTVLSHGAHDAVFWLGAPGAALMAKLDVSWPRLFDSIWVADAQGSRVATPRGRAAYDTLRSWLPGALVGNAAQRQSAAFVVAALNVVSESVDGNATLADPVRHDWPQLRGLLGRGSVALGARDTNAARYASLVEQVVANTAMITPAKLSGCPKPR